MFFVAFQPNAFQSNAFQEGFGSPSLAGHKGGDDAWKKKRVDVESKKLEFRDSDRRMRLRAAIEAQFAEPEIQQALKPYTKVPTRPWEPVKVNWEQIYANMESLERQISAVKAQRAIQEDDEEILSII